ncbi:unnamed protein product [Bursaphelenchus okinawaensis]|uniref:Large ribosomal subunit protein eL33 n=1 Tax=Bursaphelenchus okinawaensis TaxID=465554 RepID=A0A811KAV0_9BILA|nr:unnamed protein product [Bursaphelenchus okinawaensis]CAD5212908.1 unnamed protein product [Bursaphelenchus okinawaensis]CAG9098063.1 unnamed protein product [Bursaphelenchus okinawaensis]CAG9098137.1 unnamed protein product [Bursaphelenchus okinawaensis]
MSETTKTARAPNGRRLYVRAVFSGYKRGQRNQQVNTALLKLENVHDTREAQFYVGKRAVYVYKAQKKVAKGGHEKTRVRAIWGRVTRAHGNTGSVRAKFRHNLPPSAMGKRVRVMLYPSNI